MKKIMSLICAFVILSSVVTVTGFGSLPASAAALGDSNKDGAVTILDATFVQKYNARLISESEIDLGASDVDGDHAVTSRDCTVIQRYLIGMCSIDGTDPFCGENNIKLTVWASESARSITRLLCNSFTKKYPQKKITISVVVQEEGDSGFQVMMDPQSAADVFSFACDQSSRLYDQDILAPVPEGYKDEIIERNTEFSVKTASLDDTLIAYPETGENGYYLTYDKRYVSDRQAKTLEGVLAACRTAGKKFVIDGSNGYYSCMFPFTGGLSIKGLENDQQQFNDYNREEVLDSLEAFASLFHKYSDIMMFTGSYEIASGMAMGTVAAGIDGTWNAGTVSDMLGSNYGAAKLPTIKIKGRNKQIIGMCGSKLMGVNAYSKYPHAAQLLADYLTGEEAQELRADGLSWTPSNKNVIESDTVRNNKAMCALLDQANYSVPQINISDTFWSPMGTLGNALFLKSDYSRNTLAKEFDKTITYILDD